MAHYRRWTIVIFKDDIDGDWSGNARPGTYVRLAKYIQANRESDTGMLIGPDFLPTREEAFAAMKSDIDKAIGPQHAAQDEKND